MPSVYRARLGKGMDKITLGYVSSMHSDMQILEYDILGSCAHTLMLLKCKIIQKSDAKKILSALNSIKEKDLMRGGESEDVHEIVESEDVHEIVESTKIRRKENTFCIKFDKREGSDAWR